MHRARLADDLRDHAFLRGLSHGEGTRQEDDGDVQARQGAAQQAVLLRIWSPSAQVRAGDGQ